MKSRKKLIEKILKDKAPAKSGEVIKTRE